MLDAVLSSLNFILNKNLSIIKLFNNSNVKWSLNENNSLWLFDNIFLIDQSEWGQGIRLGYLKARILACYLLQSQRNYQTQSRHVEFLNENLANIIHHCGICFDTCGRGTPKQL